MKRKFPMNLLEQHVVLLHEWQELYLLTFNGNGYGYGNGNGNGYGISTLF